jgi:hypothetical protein
MTQPPKILLSAALVAVLSFSLPAQAAGDDTTTVTAASSPGKGTIVRTRKVVATVEEVDAAKGHVTLKGPKGNVISMAVGPDVRNLAQVKVGDKVVVRYLEALSLTLRKNGKELPAAKQSTDAVRTAPGARPGGAVADYVKVTADVVAVDRKNHLVRLRGPQQTVELYVADPEQLKLIEVGDQVEAEYTQAVALSVKAADAAKK